MVRQRYARVDVQDEKVLDPSRQAQNDALAAGLWERSAELAALPTSELHT